MKIVDDETLATVGVGYVDGYAFADTLLEGVLFEIVIEDGEAVCRSFHMDSRPYMERFTKEQITAWCARALEVAHEGDAMMDFEGQRYLIFSQ